MKKYASAIVAVLVVFLYIINYNNIFNYETIKEENYTKPYIEDLSILDGGYMASNEYDTRPSIRDLMVKSGGMGEANMRFDSPNEFEELSEDDNQKIFFFGRVDTDSPKIIEGEVETPNKDWDEWGYEGGVSKQPPANWVEGEVELEPIEVTLDQFLKNKEDN